jgi:hypothetical protein
LTASKKKLPVVKKATTLPLSAVKSLQTNLPLRPGIKGFMDLPVALPAFG